MYTEFGEDHTIHLGYSLWSQAHFEDVLSSDSQILTSIINIFRIKLVIKDFAVGRKPPIILSIATCGKDWKVLR